VADLYLPEGGGAAPAILVQTPYGKGRLGAALPHPAARSWLDFWDGERFALVVSDWRGFGASLDAGGGRAVPHRGTDGYDLVEWVAAQEWCDGRVAGWGPSALGRALLRTAAEKPPHLRCGVPLVCHMGHFFDDLYEGGVLEESHLSSISALGFGAAEQIRAAPLSGSPFWDRGEAESRPEELEVPLLVTGWFDLVTSGTLRFFADLRARGLGAARRDSRLLVGPWHHTAIDQARQGQLAYPAAAGEAACRMREFLSRHVLGESAPEWPEETPIRYWQMGEERWIDAPGWPPPGPSEHVLHLGADGRLTAAAPTPGSRLLHSDPEDPVPTVGGANLPLELLAGPADQRGIEARDDVLVYTTEPLAEPVALTGRAEVTLTARTDHMDFDFAVRLTDVHPDGRSMLVCDSIRRARLRGSTALPMPLRPGAVFEITVRLPPVAQTFLPGHRIRISVAGSNWPRYERNGHNGLDHFDAGDAVSAEAELLHGGEAIARLAMPVHT